MKCPKCKEDILSMSVHFCRKASATAVVGYDPAFTNGDKSRYCEALVWYHPDGSATVEDVRFADADEKGTHEP